MNPLVNRNARPHQIAWDREAREPVWSVVAGPRLLKVLPDGFEVWTVGGAEGGYSTSGDVVPALIDGTPTNDIWEEFEAALRIYNEGRDAVTALLTRTSTRSAEAVVQAGWDSDRFEEASEMGVPAAIRAVGAPLWLGATFKDYDLRTAFTMRFLRDATAEQAYSVHTRAQAAHNRLVNNAIMRRMFDPTEEANEDGRPCFGLWNGDSMVPPRYLWNTFGAGHSHYLTSGSAALDGDDFLFLLNTITEHGYGLTPGSQLVVFVHPEQMQQVAAFRAGTPDANPYDFVWGEGAPAYLTEEEVVGTLAPKTFNSLKVAGSWGPVWVVEHPYIPPNYVVMVATGGPNSDLNPVTFREHVSEIHRGLRLIPGNQQRYPLIDSFYTAGFGTGVRHRGAAAVMQITASAEYQPPNHFL